MRDRGRRTGRSGVYRSVIKLKAHAIMVAREECGRLEVSNGLYDGEGE